jgi:glycosyltransferase involved in cell wall biosynthesis
MVSARYFPYMGGVETQVYEVGRRLASAGVEVTILSTDPQGILPAFEEMDNIQIHRVRSWPSNKDYYFAPGIFHFIKSGHWDIIHCQAYHTLVAPFAMFAAWQANIPYVLTFQSGGHSSRIRNALRRPQWMMLRPLLARAQKLIALSKFEADFFQEQLRLPAEQFTVIPSGADLPEVTKSLDRTDDGPLIISIGRLERYKGHHRLITALPKVLALVPGARVRIVGAGPYESALHKMARKYGVAERVEIRGVPPGNRGGMASLIAQADLVTLLSEYESQGIAAMEALALQRPVLVVGTTALQELAERGLACAVPIESTPEEVATAIVKQLREPLLPANVELPTWDDCASKLLTLYTAITGKDRLAHLKAFDVLSSHS